MSTTPTAAARRPWWRGWADFWFRPTDPTTLGFIRIVTGLLVLYVHLAYSFDLQAFFGKHGWYALALVDKERREQPTYVTPFSGWDTPYNFARLTDYPHRRQAMLEFLRAVPGPKAERDAALAYVYRADGLQNPDDTVRALVYAQQMSTAAERDKQITVIKAGTVREKAGGEFDQEVPDFIRRRPDGTPRDEAERAAVGDEIRAFWDVLLKVKTTQARNYVFNHFVELNQEGRRALVGYIRDLPEDAAARAKRLDYLEYWNVDDKAAYRLGHSGFSVWFHVTDPTQMALVHAGVILLIVMFTLGLYTRVTSVLVWLACIGYIHRTQQVLFGMDTMMNILLFYLMIGDSGAALSLDRLRARYRAARASLGRTGALDANTRAFLACPPPSVPCGFALRLLQVHVCFIYTAAGLSKLKGPAWWSGQAFWDVMVNPEFTLLHYQWYEASLRWMAESKLVYHVMCSVSVWFTLFVEIALPFLVWTRARWFILLLASAMHAGIGVLMGLNLFELMMMVMFLSFMPDRVIRDRFRGGPDLEKFTFTFNPTVPAQARAAATAVALDADNQVALVPDKHATATAVAGPGGTESGPGAVQTLTKGLRFLSVIGLVFWIPGVRGLLARRLFPQPPAPAGPGGVKPPAPTTAR